jgi:peptidoglycan-N-acetylglucosamine deacetylase
MKTHGDAGWESFPSYLDIVVPRVLEFLKARELKITVFVVGQDAALEKNREALASIPAAGHEVGNHSFHHEPWLHLYSEPELESELARAEEAIERATGVRTIGFRGPGFSLSDTTLNVIGRRGYLYDASTFPTFLGPLARAYYFLTAKLDPIELERRRALFGQMSDGLRPLKPYVWRLSSGDLVEIPVTTMPFFRIPFHASYLLYLSVWSPALARQYFKTSILLCRMAGVAPSLLLHPLDFLGREDVRELAFFPAMGLPREKKLELLSDIIEAYKAEFQVVTMREHADEAARGNLQVRAWDHAAVKN